MENNWFISGKVIRYAFDTVPTKVRVRVESKENTLGRTSWWTIGLNGGAFILRLSGLRQVLKPLSLGVSEERAMVVPGGREMT